jgi:putative RNA 2'-phosphotransferase
MNETRRTRISKYLSKHLRHAPADIGLSLAEGGWVGVNDLLAAAAKHGLRFTREELNDVVESNSKQRFAFDAERDMIRANQGHSVEVDLQLDPAVPPTPLYHGTATRFRDAILSAGLLKMNRQHVHLSAEIATAVVVGKRHGSPVVLAVDTMSMSRDGFRFFCAANGVWLTDRVPPQYLSELPQGE